MLGPERQALWHGVDDKGLPHRHLAAIFLQNEVFGKKQRGQNRVAVARIDRRGMMEADYEIQELFGPLKLRREREAAATIYALRGDLKAPVNWCGRISEVQIGKASLDMRHQIAAKGITAIA